MARAVTLLLLAILLSGCGASTSDGIAGVGQGVGWCDRLIDDPSTGSPVPGALDQTLRSCANVDDWLRTMRRHPGLLGGREPLVVLDERCADVASGLGSFVVCRSRARALATPRPTPRPTPTQASRSTPRPRTATRRTQGSQSAGVPAIRPSFFGPGVTVQTFPVVGSTALEIFTDLETAGPYQEWLGGSASAVTRPRLEQRFAFAPDAQGGCRIVRGERPAIKVTFSVTLPRWTPPRNVGRPVLSWWNDTLLDIARHERVHVRIVRAMVAEANRVLDRSTCATVVPRLKAVWSEMQRRNCRFDMAEYGRANGLSLRACVRR